MNNRLYQYAGSLIALQRQAEEQERTLREGVRCWAGQPCKAALARTSNMAWKLTPHSPKVDP